MPNMINEILVRQLSDEFSRAQGLVVVSVNGLTVEETENLRNSLAERGVRLRVVRNRLAQLALKSRGIDAPVGLFGGNVACAWGSSEDAIAVAKIVKGSEAKKKGKVAFRGGLFEGSLLDAQSIAALAELPGRAELRAMILGLISGPARSIAVLIKAPGSSLARVLQARADKGEPAATS